MTIPLVDLIAQYKSIETEVLKRVQAVFDRQQFVLGPEVSELEQAIAAISQSSYGIGVGSGSDALLLALMAVGIGPGDEVITTPYTFFSTASSIARLHAVPVFVDIDPDTYNLDPGAVESAVTKRTRAILPVHLYGQCADMDPILAIANRHQIPVIEDAAQAIGARYKGRPAGSMGVLGCFSFFPTKNLGGAGDGGMLVTRDQKLSEEISILRVHGSRPKYYHKTIGLNSRLDSLQAAVLLVKLRYLEQWTEKRRQNAAYYDRIFRGSSHIRIMKILPENYAVYNQYVIRLTGRDGLAAHLKQQGIGTEIYYPVPLHLQECFEYLGYKKGDLPESERAAEQTLALPIYPELTERQLEHVARSVMSFLA